MKKPALSALSMCAAYHSGAASRSPSMSSSQSRPSQSRSRPSQSQSRAKQTSKVESRPQRPASPSQTPAQRPGSSVQKPSSGAGPRVDARPPVAAGARPSQSQLQQFLNLPQHGGTGASDFTKVAVGAAAGSLGYAGAQQLIQSQRPGGERTGISDRVAAGERPGSGDRNRASTLPADRVGAGGRPGVGDRPAMADRPAQLPGRPNADQIRNNLEGRYDNLFTPQWWKDHPNMTQAYWQNFGKYQYARNHWWKPATWAAVGGWVAGGAWSSPTYYDYGETIYYQDEQVYMNGKPAASAEQYYQQASDLAGSAPQSTAADTEWLPLGVFAVSRAQASGANTMLQLAVNKEGSIAGTYCNTATDVARPVKGGIDKKTQRAAWTFADGKNTDVVMETGLFNLTQDQSQALVHFGNKSTQQCLLVRLDQPKGE